MRDMHFSEREIVRFLFIERKANIDAIVHMTKFKNKSVKNMLDDIIISADIGIIKPNLGFYKYILKKHKIKPEELLFLDDNKDNVESASKLGINTIKVDREMDLLEEITKFLRISQE